METIDINSYAKFTHFWCSIGCLFLMWFIKVPVEVFPIPLYVTAQIRHFWISLFLVKYSFTFEVVLELLLTILLGIWIIDDDNDNDDDDNNEGEDDDDDNNDESTNVRSCLITISLP